jgi:hypothetical protein
MALRRKNPLNNFLAEFVAGAYTVPLAIQPRPRSVPLPVAIPRLTVEIAKNHSQSVAQTINRQLFHFHD